MADADDKAFRTEKAGDRLFPRFGLGWMQKLEALCLQLLGSGFDIRHLELDVGLRRGQMIGPLLCPKAGLGGITEGPPIVRVIRPLTCSA